MKLRIATLLKVTAAVFVALVVTAVAVVYNLDLSAYKDDITAAVKQATGRDLVIEGKFHPRIGLTPAISVERVRFANAAWGSRPDMAKIDSFRAEIALLPVLTGEIRIKRVVLVGADILLETKRDGGANWMIGAPAQPAASASGGIGTVPTVHLVSIEKSRLEYRNGKTGKSKRFSVNRLRVRADSADSPLQIDFRGAYDDAPITLDGTLGSLVRVMSGTDALPLDFRIAAGGAALTVKGEIARPLEAKGVRIAIAAEGRDLAGLTPLAGQPVPSIGPYSLQATVTDADKGWTLKDLQASLGQSRLKGEATVDPAAAPPSLVAKLTSPLIRLSDFQDAAASADRGAAADAGDGRVFPADPLPLDGLPAADAKVNFHLERVEAPGVVLRDVSGDLLLKGGRLELKPVRMNVAGGVVAAELTLGTAAGQPPKVSAKLDALGLDLAELLEEAGHAGLATGKFDVGADVTGAGGSVRAIMAGLDGKLLVTMKDGRVHDDLLEFASTNVLELITPFGSREKGIGINCLVGRYDIKGGQLKSLATLFDTTRASVKGDGGANLAEETLDFTLVPYAKEASVMALLTPMRVTGRFSAPSVYPDPGRIATGAVVGAVTGIVTMPVGVIGTVLGSVVGDDGKPSSTSANNACVAALTGNPAVAPGTQPAPQKKSTPGNPSLPGGVERTLEGIGEGLNKGLKGIFGQ